ncbi:MAG: hypothetical protein WBE26_07660 [Phycisphaerae bacterium]
MYFISLIVAVALGQMDVRSHLPEQLQEAMESRKAQTSEIEWTITYLQGRDAGLVERHVARTVGDTVWDVNLGDEKGYHRIAFHHVPRDDSEEALREAAIPQEELAGPYHSLVYEGRAWHLEHQKGSVPDVGNATPLTVHGLLYDRPFDWTAAGIGPWWYHSHAPVLGLRDDVLEGFDSATYTVTSRGGVETITAEFDGKTIEWEVDKTRGGYPIHAAFYHGDKLWNSSYTDLTEIDGRWFPTSISFYKRDDGQPYKAINVQKASFDKPWHRQEITPEDIGVLFGTQLLGPNGYNCWDGTKLITYDEYSELIYIYGLRPDRVIVERMANAEGITVEEYLEQIDKTSEYMRAEYLKAHGEAPWLVKKTDVPDEWDIYVAEFIKKHKLDEPRTKRANELLERAKKLRDYHLHKNRSKIRKAEQAGDTAKVARYDAITQRIFERLLVRGLHKLIPRAGERKSG